jgi:hypothetical protein
MIIGLCGYAGSGKTTAANYLTQKHAFKEATFAGPLKDIAKIIGFTDKQLHGTQDDKLEINKQLNISAREFMQKFGTDICRNQFPKIFPNMNLGKSGSIWVKLMENYIENHPDTLICCSDIRFPDELELISSYQNSIIIQIHRDNESNEYHNHVSETSLPDIVPDYQIINNSSLEDLYETIDNILKIRSN